MASKRARGRVVLVVAALVTSAWADGTADAKRHYARGVELARDGLYAEAAAEFDAAYRAKPHFAVLYNLGQSWVALGRPVEASDALERYLREGGSEVPSARREQVQAELARQRSRVGTLALRGVQAGATIKLDGRELGRAPLAPIRLAVGAHSLSAELSGFAPRVVDVTIVGEETSTVDLALTPVPREPPAPAPALLAVTCSVPGVLIELDGRPLGATPSAAPFVVPSGARALRFSRVGYATTQRAVTLTSGQAASMSCELSPLRPLPPAYAARLVVRASEAPALALLDGVELPTDGVVPIGAHELTVSSPGFHTAQRHVVLEPGATRVVELTLVPTPEARAAYERRARTTRTAAYVSLGAGVAALAGGAYLWKSNDDRHQRWEAEDARLAEQYRGKPPHPPDLDQRQAANDELIRSIQRTDKYTVGLLAGGAVLSGLGIALWAWGDSPGRYPEVTVSASARGATWACRGTFL